MPPISIPASFWRGGTSRGLLVRAEALAPFPHAIRDRILKTALGTPDPAGRQIDGLGGGASSLSKVAIVGPSGEATDHQKLNGILPGVGWADRGTDRDGNPYDVVYRFGQVPIRNDDAIDWTASCGNLVAAVALASLTDHMIPYTTLFTRSRALKRRDRDARGRGEDEPIQFPISILSASNGVVVKARVPIDPVSLQVYEPDEPGRGCRIAGVPGQDEPGIEVELPLGSSGGRGGALVTGRAKDVVPMDDGHRVTVSIVTAGLPNVFVPVSSLARLVSLPEDIDVLTLSGSELDSIPHLNSTLARIRTNAALEFGLPLSLASPKITLVGPVPRRGYTTSAGDVVGPDDADLLVRAVSSGDWHATIPGTTLGALNVAAGTRGTVVDDLVREAGRATEQERVTVRAGHLAGVAESTVRFSPSSSTGIRTPESVVMMRTAREIMRGNVLIPERVFR